MRRFTSLNVSRTARMLVLPAAAVLLLLAVVASPADAQLTARQLLSNAVSDYGPQYSDVEQALAHFREGKLDEARKALAAAKAKNPQLAPADVMLAHVLFAGGQAAAGVAVLEKVTRDEPHDPEAFIMLGDLALRQRRLTEAELLFEKGLDVSDTYSQNQTRKNNMQNSGLAGMAAVAEASGDWKLATERIAAWQHSDPRDANARTRMGLARFRMKDYDGARESFANARKLNDKLPTADVSLAAMHAQVGDAAAAEKLYLAAAKANPNDLNTRLAVVRWALDAGKNDLAAENVAAAKKIDSASLEVKLAAGLAARYAGDHNAAMAALEDALKDSPRNFTAMNHLALTLIDSTDEKERIRALGYAQLSAQTNANRQTRPAREATVTLAWIMYRLGHADVAGEVLKGILNAGPIGSESAYYASLILLDRGQAETAKKILETALNADTHFPGREEAERILAQLAKRIGAAPRK